MAARFQTAVKSNLLKSAKTFESLFVEGMRQQGQPCLVCGDTCPGFALHFFRKVCSNCRCDASCHGTLPDKTPVKTVGRLSEALKRFEQISVGNAASATSPGGAPPPRPARRERDGALVEQMQAVQTEATVLSAATVFAWTPPSLSKEDTLEFFAAPYPIEQVPVAGSAGMQRLGMLQERQMPAHDLDSGLCDGLTGGELDEFRAFIELKEERHCIGVVRRLEPATMCKHCREVIKLRSLGVSVVEHAGHDYHPWCFVCAECTVLLAGLHAFHHEGQLYCGRHFADKFKARCRACDESILEERYAIAEGCTWHVKHFCCYRCDGPLGSQPYVPIDKQPWCMPCFHRNTDAGVRAATIVGGGGGGGAPPAIPARAGSTRVGGGGGATLPATPGRPGAHSHATSAAAAAAVTAAAAADGGPPPQLPPKTSTATSAASGTLSRATGKGKAPPPPPPPSANDDEDDDGGDAADAPLPVINAGDLPPSRPTKPTAMSAVVYVSEQYEPLWPEEERTQAKVQLQAAPPPAADEGDLPPPIPSRASKRY